MLIKIHQIIYKCKYVTLPVQPSSFYILSYKRLVSTDITIFPIGTTCEYASTGIVLENNICQNTYYLNLKEHDSASTGKQLLAKQYFTAYTFMQKFILP